ncbi:GNAT family N-acetyltransferase [Marvinbryantia sp.]|uniref:GNAT family N-acetyltransferase n=1 Tax=Marvinbryantia sp. TaxID=2496532 RepID=UPI003A928A90
MEKVASAALFGERVKAFKKKNRPVVTNCFFVPAEVEDMIRREKLYVEEAEEALCIQVREAYYSRLYYYMKEGAQLPALSGWMRPVILDTVFRGDEEAALAKCKVSRWCAHGFAEYKRYRRMECAKENFLPPADQRAKLAEYPIVPLKPQDYPEVAALWKSSLDIYSTLLPQEAEFAEYCEEQQVIGVRLPDGTAGAVIMVIPKGKTGFMQHLVVSTKLRGLGMGRTLFCGATEYLLTKGGADKVNFWVDEENIHAIAIYQKMGYIYDGVISRQFLLGEK